MRTIKMKVVQVSVYVVVEGLVSGSSLRSGVSLSSRVHQRLWGFDL